MQPIRATDANVVLFNVPARSSRPRHPLGRAGVPKAPGPDLMPYDSPVSAWAGEPLGEAERGRAIDAVQECICAALAGDRDLCELRLKRVIALCAGRPAAEAAAGEVDRVLALDIAEP
ncbi:hypothetical protein, partial [Roseateles sp.]|uniref:hypothetical protein n=1 Tax=Roseateles sp. TaxID=1971397 RepID=UPI002DFBE55C|nr:hypothetical protein [Roseateles sp.]